MATFWNRKRQERGGDRSKVIDPVSSPPKIEITLVNYNAHDFVEHENVEPTACEKLLDPDSYNWIHVQGQPKPSFLRELGEIFSLHPLALEDVMEIGERSKTESYESQVVVILGIPVKQGNQIINEQVTLFLGKNFLISIHSGKHDPFRAVRKRLSHPQSLLRKRKIDYLLYVLVDVIVDYSLPLLDQFEKEIEIVEHDLLGAQGEDTFQTLYHLKRELLVLRLKLRPQRETIRLLMRYDSELIQEETKVYLRDCYDHMIRLVDIIEIYRDITTNMLDVHLSLVNRKTFISNEVQRKATVLGALFAPLTFITGIYGMNLLIPEFKWHLGYMYVLIMMLVLGVGFVAYFKHRKWI